MPRISIILPIYNGSAFLSESIESVLSQTFTNFELLIINDGSTDDSESIIKEYTDPRIIYIKNSMYRKVSLLFFHKMFLLLKE